MVIKTQKDLRSKYNDLTDIEFQKIADEAHNIKYNPEMKDFWKNYCKTFDNLYKNRLTTPAQ